MSSQDLFSEQGSMFWKQRVAKEEFDLGIDYEDQGRVPTSITGARQLEKYQAQKAVGGSDSRAYSLGGTRGRFVHAGIAGHQEPQEAEKSSSSQHGRIFGRPSFHMRPDVNEGAFSHGP